MIVRRLAAFALCLLLAACGGGGPSSAVYPPLTYDYLTRLRLNVASIDIDDSWAPRGGDRHVEYLAPTTPVAALRQMAQDRLVAGGQTGRAVFVIDDASIILVAGQYEGRVAVHLDILADNGVRSTAADAHAIGTVPATDPDDPEAVRSDLYGLVRKMMNGMNVDFEYQLHQSMRGELQLTSPNAPPPPPVQTQDLGEPGQAPPPDQPPPPDQTTQ